MSSTFMPQFLVKSLIKRLATFNFQAESRAWPSSSIVRAITAAPCSTTNGMILANLEVGPSPSS